MDLLITLVCVIGIICANLTVIFNINLVIKIVLKKSKRNEDMILFYYRFTLDIFFGFCLLLYIIFVLLSILAPQFMVAYRTQIVYLALPWSNLNAARNIIAFSIATERVMAAYFPLKFRSKRNRFPNWSILMTALGFGLSEELVLFQLCAYDMQIPLACRVFGCAVNRCFYNYWTMHKTITFSAIVFMSILLSIRLFVWNNCSPSKKNIQLSRANRLALLDTVTVLIFDFLPSFCGNTWPTFPLFSFDYVGPYNAVGKVIGCAIESIVVTTVLIRNSSPSTTTENISSQRRTTVKKTSMISENRTTPLFGQRAHWAK